LRRKGGGEAPGIPRFTSVYSANGGDPVSLVTSPLETLQFSGLVGVSGKGTFEVRHGVLEQDATSNGVWRLATPETQSAFETVDGHTYCRFGDLGAVRVGVKTTADKVFIREDWDELPPEIQPELLLPLTTHHIGRRYRAHPPKKQILYTH